MKEIKWEPIVVERQKKAKTKPATVSINAKTGRIFINKVACELIDEISQYPYAELLQAKSGSKVAMLGIQFKKEKTASSCGVKPIKAKNGVTGYALNSKAVASMILGDVEGGKPSKVFTAEKYDDGTLAVALAKPIK